MGLKLYVSRVSGSTEIKKKQESIVLILEGRKIEFEEVDITDPSNEEAKKFMREHGKVKEGQRVSLPPQLFNGDAYCGDYDDFHEACELETLEEFLKLTNNESGDANGVNNESS